MVTKHLSGETNLGEELFFFTLESPTGLQVDIINYGAAISSIRLPKDNSFVDVALGFDKVRDYKNNPSFFGSVIGRNANRVFPTSGKVLGNIFNLEKNDGENNLHSGNNGFHNRIFTGEVIDSPLPTVKMSLYAEDLSDGFPGNLEFSVIYTLKDDTLRIDYQAVSDKDTIVNPTNHVYFNMNGHDSGSVENHMLSINADYFTPVNENLVPTGEILSVANTALDYSQKKPISTATTSDDENLASFGGLDHNFIFKPGSTPMATVVGDKTGFSVSAYSSLNAMQVYTGNSITTQLGKAGAIYQKHSGICLETQKIPNSINLPWVKSAVLKAGEEYSSWTEYKFTY